MSNAAERRAAKRRSPEAKALDAGVELLMPLLTSIGFSYRSGDSASSSGGPFANGYFIRDTIEIGLIVRDQCQMGVPNYSRGNGYASHDKVLAALKLDHKSQLTQTGHFAYAAKNGGDPFQALLEDLRDLMIPALERSEDEFFAAIDSAVKEFQDRLRGKSNG